MRPNETAKFEPLSARMHQTQVRPSYRRVVPAVWLLYKLTAWLHPGRNEIRNRREQRGQKSEQRANAEGNQLPPKFHPELSRTSAGYVAEGSVAMHAGVDHDQRRTRNDEHGKEDTAQHRQGIEWVARYRKSRGDKKKERPQNS